MLWGRLFSACAMVIACAMYVPAHAQVFDQPGGDVQWVPLALSVLTASRIDRKGAASPDAVYSNLRTFRNESYAAGGATQQVLNTITRLAADDLNLVGTPPYSVNGFRFTVANLNAVDVTARPQVRFWLPDGPGGGPGTLIEARTYNPTLFTAGRVGTIKTSSTFVLQTSHIWAGVVFDNNGGTTGATAAQLDNLAQGIFSPPDLGTSTDRYFVTTAAGSFASDNPVGTIGDFGGAPPADFGWEILTAQNVDLSITNSDSVATAAPGGSVVYTITASNAGPDTVFDARVVDTFPASLTCSWTCAGSAGNTCAASGTGNINDATVGLAVGGSVTYTASCAVSPAATGTLVNTATILAPGTAVEASIADNSATDTDVIGVFADLAITKTDGVTTATPGGSVTYTITASNAGPNDTAGATVTDTFPAALTCTWSCVSAGGGTCTAAGNGNINDTVNLPASGSVTYTAGCTIAAAATGTLSNTATVVAPAGVTDPTPGNNSATDSDTLTPPSNLADLAITNTDGVTSATPGGNVRYTITASNPGPSSAIGATVADTFPPSLTCTWICVGAGGGTCTASGSGNLNDTVNLPAGGSVTYAASCTIAAAATGTLSNTATVAPPAGVTDPNPGNNSATDSDTLSASANLAITLTDGVTSATPGGRITYTIAASNAGPSNAAGATVADTFPASLTCTWTCVGGAGGTCTPAGSGNVNDTVNLPPGGSATYTASCMIAAAASGTVSNTATITAPAGVTDPNPGNNSATDSDTLDVPQTLIVDPANQQGWFTKPGSTAAASLSPTSPAGNPAGPGALKLVLDGVSAGQIVNVARIPLPILRVNEITAMAWSASSTDTALPLLMVEYYEPGGRNGTLFPVQPAYPGDGSWVTIDAMTLLWKTTESGFGASQTFAQWQAELGPVAVSFFSVGLGSTGSTVLPANTAYVDQITLDGTTWNFEGDAPLLPPPQLPPTIAKAFGAGSIALNGTTTLTFTLTNPDAAFTLTGVGFTDTLPAGLVVATPNGLTSTCGGTVTAVAGAGSVDLVNGGLLASGSCEIRANVTGTSAGVKNNTTSAVTSTEGGPGGTGSASLTVQAAVVVVPPAIAKAFGVASIVVNGTTTLMFTLTNPNAATALTGVGFTDTLPTGLVVATPSGLTGTCGGAVTATTGTGSIALVNGSLPATGACTITLNVVGTSAGTKNNTTGAVSSTEGGAGGTASASVTVTAPLVVVPPTIAIAFGASSIALNTSTQLTFNIGNPNTSNSLGGVAFTNVLPAGLVVATPNGLTGSCGGGTITANAGSGSISLSGATLAASASCTFGVNVTGTTAGTKNNTTGAITSVEGGSGGTASASVIVTSVVPPSLPTTPIPTLQDWALLLLGVLMLMTASVTSRRRGRD